MANYTKVRELDFSDLYLGHPALSDRFSDVPGAASNPLPASAELREDLDLLTAACRGVLNSAPAESGFKVWHDGVAYRVAVMKAQGGTVFVLRKVAADVHTLAELGVPQAYIRHLLQENLTGLFVIAGGIKSGKTMTACAMLRERLLAHGGVAVTRENPIELPLEGAHGKGVCFQTEGTRRSGDEQGELPMMRWGARMILVDEIRDADAALELLQASVNGHLIITTMLADNVIQAVAKLHAMVLDRMVTTDGRALLVEGLSGVLHQRLARGARPKLETEFLFFRDAPQVRATLRSGNYDQLESDMRKQMATMIAESAAIQRNMAGLA